MKIGDKVKVMTMNYYDDFGYQLHSIATVTDIDDEYVFITNGQNTIGVLQSEVQNVDEELVKPERYNKGSIEVWDFILDQGLGFLEGNIIKYLCRSDKKGGLEDRDSLHRAHSKSPQTYP